jgi:hypothetical protein
MGGEKKTEDREEVNLLIIGPASCGKTAIIYFLYQFAAIRLKEKMKRGPNDPKPVTNSTAPLSVMIGETELTQFVNEIKKELVINRDFTGTDPGSIRYINYDTGKLKLRIYNISGEIFGNTSENEPMLRALGDHLETIDVQQTYCLLCDEYRPKGEFGNNIDFNDVNIIYDGRYINAQHIFTNIINNVNTLRVVTKFDRAYKLKGADGLFDAADKNFEVIHEPFARLNDPEAGFMATHQVSYANPENESFTGWGGKSYWKQFICTGLFDKVTPSEELYAFDAELGRPMLKPAYSGQRNGLTRLDMFGIKEIFEYILRDSKIKRGVSIFGPLKRGTSERHQLSYADYKKILGL